MANLIIEEAFKQYLLSSYPIDEILLDKLTQDLGDYFSLSVSEFVSSRHGELHSQGLKNSEIYEQIQKEILNRRFAGPELTIRQIRRIIYG